MTSGEAQSLTALTTALKSWSATGDADDIYGPIRCILESTYTPAYKWMLFPGKKDTKVTLPAEFRDEPLADVPQNFDDFLIFTLGREPHDATTKCEELKTLRAGKHTAR